VHFAQLVPDQRSDKKCYRRKSRRLRSPTFPPTHTTQIANMSAKRKSITSLAKPALRSSPKVATKYRIDESNTAVISGLAPKSVQQHAQPSDEQVEDSASTSEVEDSENDQVIDEAQQPRQSMRKEPTENSSEDYNAGAADNADADADAEMTSPKPDEQDDTTDAEPTFGDLVRGSSTVDVSSALATQASNAVDRAGAQSRHHLMPPVNATSLGTVLNQALKTDDRDLLESCLQVSDAKIVQNTINRMDSSLAIVLLSKLADRMHRRPGRAFGLMRWMQLTLIAHGGTLVRQPDLTKKLGDLSRVLEERSRGLGSLLALKGKLDMLDQQMQHRRAIKHAKAEGSDGEDSDDVDEPGVVYVEGREDDQAKALPNGTSGQDDDDDVTGANGLIEESDDESEEEDDDEDDLMDDMAEAESFDEDDVDHDDVEEEESGEEEEEDQDDDEDSAPPSKLQKVSSKFGKRK